MLWDECRSLLSALRGPSKRTEPLAKQVDRIRSISADNSMVQAVLSSIPQRVLVSGAETEHTLQRRFNVLKTSCSRVALVGEKGGGLMTYVLSYVQSYLVVPYRRWQLNRESVDVTEMDTYDLLELADRQIQQGCLEEGVRLLNQLQGQPRHLAQDWLDEARVFLATRQALELLMAEALVMSTALP